MPVIFALVALSMVPQQNIYAQTFTVPAKREYSSSIGKNFILEFQDSTLEGRFIGAPQLLRQSLFTIFPPPRFDGSLQGRLHNGLWSGHWRDAGSSGKFTVQFNADYSDYKGAFCHGTGRPIEWSPISGSAIDDIWSWEGKRSPVIAGASSLFASGAGHWYNRQYEKANTYGMIDMVLPAVGGVAAVVFWGNLVGGAATGSPVSGGAANGLILAQLSLGAVVVSRIIVMIDAIISA